MSSRLIIRFSLNQGKQQPAGGYANRMRDGVRLIVPKLLLEYADETYAATATRLVYDIRKDVQRELANVAQRYRQMIFTGGLRTTGPQASDLTTADGQGPLEFNPGAKLGAWPKRTAKYMASSVKKATPQWFLGATRTMIGMMGKRAVWEEMFGPVKVTVQRTKSSGISDLDGSAAVRRSEENTLGGARASKPTRVGLLQVKVAALNKVSTGMLRNKTQSSGLITLAYAHNRQLGYRMGGRMPAKHRPTLNPFIEFFLTKAMGYAVEKRIAAGIGAKTNVLEGLR